ncbi:MAG: 50S ribosomal protein L6 [Planctomycetota bacterium]|jgi:large subunit ribosomal protein L6
MSRLGKIPVPIPDKVKVSVSGQTVQVEGPVGKLSLPLHPGLAVEVDKAEVRVVRKSGEKQARIMHGTTRAHLANMVLGAAKGFEKILDINGVGYNAQIQGQTLKLTLGFSHPVELSVPMGLKLECPNPTTVMVRGADRQQVGQFAAQVRSARPVEPYNLKGVKYRDEVVRKKAGKTFVTGAT